MSRQIGDPVNLGRYELYPELKVRQRAVSRGLPGLAIFGLYAAFTLFNDWRYAHHIAGERVYVHAACCPPQIAHARRRRVEEEQEYRHNVLPFFQAEEDRRYAVPLYTPL